ncbi:MAG: peptidoglycan D,D-transpeptidase FtsI family protein [Acidimicrobiia bacterium]
MNSQIRRLGAGLLACFVALTAMVHYVQAFRADSLNDDPRNTRTIVRDFDRARGQIVSADGRVLARTVPSAEGDRFAFQRQYPETDLFGHITGHFNFDFGATGVEQTYNDRLAGTEISQQYQTLRDLFSARDHTADVSLTIRADVQETARDALGETNGAVVALDPRDGSVLALWSYPSYDPNLLSTHDRAAADAARTQLSADPNRPLRGKSWQERFFPGSTFKVVTGAVGVDVGKVTNGEPAFPVETAYDPPDGEPIQNFDGERCGGPLPDILRVSCNSAFARMGAEVIGPGDMGSGSNDFGFNDSPPFDLPAVASSVFPDTGASKALLGQAAIGQFDVQASPLQMAMVAAAVANNGIVMTPHVMQEVRSDSGQVLDTYEPTPWRTAISPQTASTMRDAMRLVVERGTGTAAQIPGVDVGGKTGTAQITTVGPDQGVLAWFICWAQPPGVSEPTAAVAVVVENQVGLSDATGGRVAAPIARDVLEKVLETQAANG